VLQSGDTLKVSRKSYAGTGPRVNVLGQVKTPGEYTLSAASNTVALAIAAAGGLSTGAGSDIQILEWRLGKDAGPIAEATDRSNLTITHVSRRMLDEHRAPLMLLRSDDAAVWVPEREIPASGGRVMVTGDVVTPLDLTFTGTLTLKDAIAKAGGPNPTAGPSIMLTRTASAADTTRRSRELVTWHDVADGSLDLTLRDGDAIEVPRRALLSPPSVSISVSLGAGKSQTGWQSCPPGLTLQQALDNFNRPSPFSPGPSPQPIAMDHVTIQRQVEGRMVTLTGTPDFVLQANDKVIVSR
jgi:protein involved in polysaccharide export with SLBB domain